MATKLTKNIVREIELDGKTYTVTLGLDGVKMVEKRHRTGAELSWKAIRDGVHGSGRA